MPSDRDSSSNSSGRNGNTTTTRVITKRFVPGTLQTTTPDVIATQKHEEWTTSKKVVNHKTKQVETRVQRQIVLEDGKVVADSGPQVTTKTTEDNKVEESENTQHKTTGDDGPKDDNYIAIPGSARVVSEKTETHQVMKESKEENMQLHDENLKELNGPEIHRKSLVLAPSDSPFYTLDTMKQLPGKMTHFSSKSQKITDKEEVKEVSETKNGEMTTETTRTHHHEEVHDDEVPEDQAKALPDASTTPKRLTYNFEEEIDSLSDKIRKEKELNIIRDIAAERRDPVTRKALSIEEEEEIRNSETNRWLEHHFGSDESDIVEPSPRGGNIINIKMTSTPKVTPKESPVHRTSFTTTVNNHSHNHDQVDSKFHKSVGSRFCGTREPDVVYTTLRTPTPSRSRDSPDLHSSLSGSRTPLKTYYLGQEGSYQRLSPPKETPSRRVSAPVWKSTPTLNDPIETTFKPRFLSRDETNRDVLRTLRTSPVQRSVSQRDISPRQRLRSKVTAHDDGFIHKFNSRDYLDEDNDWLTSKTLPRGQKFTGEVPRHRTSYSEVQSFSTGGRKVDRSVQVELSDDESQVFSTLTRVRSPSPVEYEIQSLPRRTGKKSVLVGTNKNKMTYFGNSSNNNAVHKTDDYRKLYGKSDGTTSRYSDGYGSLASSKDRYHSLEKEDSSIDRRIASFNSYGKTDSYDGSTITSDYTRNNRFMNDIRTVEKRNNSKNSRTVDEDYRRKSSSNDRRNFIDTLLSAEVEEEAPVYTRKVLPERRQRMFSNSPPSPPTSPSNSPMPRLIRADRYGGSSSLSPPESPVAPPPPPPPPTSTWNNRNRSKSTGSPVVKMPSFTPLLSPLEIKNMANTINRTRSRDETRLYNDKYLDVKNGGKNGTVVVEVRDWGNR